jgi:diguanylate cyclase (GGDEF)-like protein
MGEASVARFSHGASSDEMISKPSAPMSFAPPDVPASDRYAAHLLAIRRLASQLAHSGAPDELARVLVEELQRTLAAAWVALYRADPAGSFSRRALAGDPGARLPATISGGDAVALRRPTTPLDERIVASDALMVFGGAATALALEDAETRLGWLVSGSRLDGVPFDRLDADLIALMCDIAAPRLAAAEFDAQYARSALTDQLTGLGNRRAFNERLEEEIARANRGRTALALLLVDLDKFAAFNATHGRDAGDRALGSVSVAVRSSIRLSDSAFRYGGGQFALLLPGAAALGAFVAAERIRNAVTALESGEVPAPITVSIGIASLREGSCSPISLASLALVRKADEALYQAKQSGRNRTVIG